MGPFVPAKQSYPGQTKLSRPNKVIPAKPSYPGQTKERNVRPIHVLPNPFLVVSNYPMALILGSG